MRLKLVIVLVAAMLGVGIAGQCLAADPPRPWCTRGDVNCDGRIDWRDRYYDPQRGYNGRPYTYGSEGFCPYPTSRGTITGYKPQGKDRCCVETRNGPHCVADVSRPWCARGDSNCDGRVDWRDRYYDPQRGYNGRPFTYASEGTCPFPTPHGTITGYKPQGKDRCCIETRNGPTCR
jgi:hypothetical protein